MVSRASTALPAVSNNIGPLTFSQMADGSLNGQDAEDALQDRLSAFVVRLEDEASRRVDRRLNIEQRWIEDLQQYHGRYDGDTLRRLTKNLRSEVFINLTATKTEAMEARLSDLLFPTDDRNWGVGPTPVPELTDQAEAALNQVDEAKEHADAAQAETQRLVAEGNLEAAGAAESQMRAAEDQQNVAQMEADRVHEVLNEAKRRADLMQKEIDDQLVTCDWQAEARDLIRDACKIGIGIVKGPVIGDRHKQRWGMRPEKQDAYQLETVVDEMPAAYRVDPWSFFPDPDVSKPEDSEGFFERHLLNKQQLRKLARRPDIDKDAVRGILKAGPTKSAPAYLTDLYDLTGQSDGDVRKAFQVWEYTGSIETEDMALLLEAFDDTTTEEELDPLEEHHAKVWFCQGKVLSFGLHPLDSKEPIYSTFTIRPDESSLFGFGIPYIMRHPQSVLNGAYRMMMDNSGLGTGPQIVVNRELVTPENGDWRMAPMKVWLLNTTAMTQTSAAPFQTFHIESHQAELANIIDIAMAAIDEVTAMPRLAQGEQGSGVTKTAQGMAILMNSANIVFRRIVKAFDDGITVPLIRRFYHWNMQFSEKEAIKGDYEVQARGSGVLLVREMQAQNLMLVAQQFGDHPIYGPMLKHGELLRQIFRSMMIPADEITKTDREYEQWLSDQQAMQDPAAAAEMAKVEVEKAKVELMRDELDQKAELANMEWSHRLKIAKYNYDAAMEKTTAQQNMSHEEMNRKLMDSEGNRTSKERVVAAEIAMKRESGDSAGGSV